MENTGYWIFYCNPKMWAIDDFLEEETEISTWKVTDWQKKYFQKGQLGLVRVGIDNRTKNELNGKEKLKSGIYAIVEILGEPEYKTDIDDSFWIDEKKPKEEAWRVKIKFVKNLLANPILIENLKLDGELGKNTALIKGRQNSSWSISKNDFQKLAHQFEVKQEEIKNVREEFIFEEDDIIHLEKKYKNYTPRIKEILSKKIERGEISKAVKKWYNYECLICKAIDLNPLGFKKRNGEYYIETHHFFPVSELKKGSLGLKNLMTLCPNHHRQIHYGKVKLISSDEEYFIIELEGKKIEIKKKQPTNRVHYLPIQKNNTITQMKKERVIYSTILLQFIEPILDGSETEEDILMKAKLGMIAWNYHLSDQNKLPYDDEMKAILKDISAAHDEGSKMLNKLVLRKEMKFAQYKQFIAKVEIRTKPDDSKTLYVESYPIDKIGMK